MTKNISLAKYTDPVTNKEINITIDKYLEYIKNKEKYHVADFLYHRLHSRYLKPFMFDDINYKKKYKNGFSILANCCLLIETLESFKNGWGDSYNKSEIAFIQFFKRDKYFAEFNTKGKEFYKNVRCGILHQGETTGGYKITRNGKVLFDAKTKTINAYIFSTRMEKSLDAYKKQLVDSEWDSEVWDNFRTKMRKIVENCNH